MKRYNSTCTNTSLYTDTIHHVTRPKPIDVCFGYANAAGHPGRIRIRVFTQLSVSLRNDLYCVGWGVKLTHSVSRRHQSPYRYSVTLSRLFPKPIPAALPNDKATYLSRTVPVISSSSSVSQSHESSLPSSSSSSLAAESKSDGCRHTYAAFKKTLITSINILTYLAEKHYTT